MDINYSNVPMQTKFFALSPGDVFTRVGKERPMLVLRGEYGPPDRAVDLSNGEVTICGKGDDVVPLVATLSAKPRGT